MDTFTKLKTVSVAGVTDIIRPEGDYPLSLDSPALSVFVDFEQQSPFMLEQGTGINDAIAIMKREHVRRKLVIDSDEHFRGVVSMGDLVSSKVVKAAQERGLTHNELAVEDVMVDKEHLHAVERKSLTKARIGDLLITMNAFGDEHLLVVDESGSLCGLVSSTDVARSIQLPAPQQQVSSKVTELFGIVPGAIR